MDAVLTSTTRGEALKEIALLSVNQKFILQGVTWETYEEILAEFTDSNALHFAYDDGTLEIEMPTPKHELISQILSDFITRVCSDLEVDVRNFRSTTFRQKPKTKGVEPDVCFYVRNERQMRGKTEVNLMKDPPPDLVVEVDITSPSLNRIPIYAALGVPEIWIYKDEKVVFQKLVGGKYRVIERSLALPILTSEIVTEFLEKGLTESSSAWFREVRDWVKSQKD